MAGISAKRILIVDDEPLVCESLRLALGIDGHVSEVVYSAEEALAQFGLGKFDVVFIDFKMPGMKGDQLAREIKTRDPAQTIILLTGSPPLPIPVDIAAVILKPFDLELLRKTLAAVAA